MDAKEARKLATAKTESNYLVVQLSFDEHIILPYKDGLMLLQALETAEIYRGVYSNTPGIHPLETGANEKLETTIMSRERYVRIKMAQLMGVSEEFLKEKQV